MSLETVLAANTAAIKDLTAAVLLATSAPAMLPTAGAPAASPSAPSAVKTDGAPLPPAPAPTPSKSTVVPIKAPEAAPALVLDYHKDVAPRVMDLARIKGRDALAALLAEFGAARGQLVPVARLPELSARLDSALAS